MVPRRGLEPPRPCERQHLKLVRLPIPPSGHGWHQRQCARVPGRRGPLAGAWGGVNGGLRRRGEMRRRGPRGGCLSLPSGLVRSRRLELPRAFAHNDLNVARLPIPPRPLNQRGAKSLGFLAPRGGRSGPLAKGAGGRKLETRVNPRAQLVPAGDGADHGVARMVNRALPFPGAATDRLCSCRRCASGRASRCASAKRRASQRAGHGGDIARGNL